MFDTFILQQLQKLVESEIGDFTSPEAFHSCQVQRFKSKCIKASTQVGSEFPMPVKALSADLAIQYRQLSDGTPPVSRTFFLTRKALVERTELFQGLFQELWTLYLFVCRKCQICVLHSKLCQWHNLSLLYIVCPNALTCRRKPRFGRSIVCCDTNPIVSTSITFYRDLLNIARSPITVLVECERDRVSYPFSLLRIPFTKGYCDTIIFYLPTRHAREGNRLEFVLGFDTRSATQFVEKSVVSCVYTFQLTLDHLTRQTLPMWVCRLFQLRQMSRHRMIVRIRQTVFIALTLPQVEILMHFMHIVQQIPQAFILRVFAYLMFIGSHWFSRITLLTPFQWVGRHVTLRLRWKCLPT